jgi:hypothetical protein
MNQVFAGVGDTTDSIKAVLTDVAFSTDGKLYLEYKFPNPLLFCFSCVVISDKNGNIHLFDWKTNEIQHIHIAEECNRIILTVSKNLVLLK